MFYFFHYCFNFFLIEIKERKYIVDPDPHLCTKTKQYPTKKKVSSKADKALTACPAI